MIARLRSQADGRFYYLASPYSHEEAQVRDIRAHRANDFAAHFMTKGIYIYQPIWSTHRIAKNHDLPVEFEWWVGFNKAFIDASAGVIVCDIDGWHTSRGVRQEIDYARSIALPVYFCERETMKVTAL